MGRPRLYATSVERKAAWRRRQGMAVRPHYPAAAKQAAYRARKQQAAQALAARECAAIQQALQTRALADQCWELYELHRRLEPGHGHAAPGPGGPPPGLLADASAHFYGMAAARVRRHRRALQRLAHVRAPRGAQASTPSDASTDRAAARVPTTRTGGVCRARHASQARRQAGRSLGRLWGLASAFRYRRNRLRTDYEPFSITTGTQYAHEPS